MRFTRRFVASLLLLTVLASCGHHDHSHDAAGHAHTSADIERPTVAVTLWTDRTELFMEYPVFVAGESGRAAIHVTDLSDFSPLREGEAIVTLRAADGRMLEFRGGPTRPGIFGVDLQADRPGMHVMTLRVEAPGLEDVHELGAVTVYDPGHVPEQPGDEQEEGISFLKEQQWTLDFATVLAEVRALRPSLTVTGAIEARPGGDATLTAPVPGRIDPSSGVPIPGTRVREGDVLARIVPRSDDLRDAAALRAALVEAEQEQGLAARESERVERLVASRAVPARRLDEARAALAATTARLEAARERWSRYEALSQSGLRSGVPGGFSVRAPFAGVVSGVFFASGESVDDGRALVRLVDTDRVHAVGAVPEANAGDLRSVESAELLLDGQAPVELPRPL